MDSEAPQQEQQQTETLATANEDASAVKVEIDSDPKSHLAVVIAHDPEATRRKLRKARDLVLELSIRLDNAKDRVKELRAELDQAKRAVFELVNETLDPPLFSKRQDDQADNQQAGEGETSPSPAATCDDQSWRSTRIDSIGLRPTTSAKLIEAKLTTVGEVADFSSGGAPLTDIDGVGERTAEEIQDALERFWGSRRPK